MSAPQNSQAPQDAQDTVLSQSTMSLCNSANAVAELLTRVGNRISETGQVDDSLIVCLVCLETVKDQLINHIATAQEINGQRQVTKSMIEEVTKKLEQIQETLEHGSKDTMAHIRQQLELTSSIMADDSKRMSDKCIQALALTGESMVEQIEKLELTSEETKMMSKQAKEDIRKMAKNATSSIDNATDRLHKGIKSMEQTTEDSHINIRRSADLLKNCQEVLTYTKQVKKNMAQANEAAVLTMEELKLAKEDMARERLMFQDQRERLEQKINEMIRHMESRDAENKGLKNLYSKLSAHALRSVQSATNFREAQYKFLVDGFARFEQKIAYITHQVSNSAAGTLSGKPSNALLTSAAAKTSNKSPPKPKTDAEKIAEMQKTINKLQYDRDILTNNNKLLQLRVAKFEADAEAQAAFNAPASPISGSEPDSPCAKTLKSVRSRRSLHSLAEEKAAGAPSLRASVSNPNLDTKESLSAHMNVVHSQPSIEALIQSDLWERLLSPSLLPDECKRRLRLIKPQVTGGLRLEDIFLRVASIVSRDDDWAEFNNFMKYGVISKWYCVKDMLVYGQRACEDVHSKHCPGIELRKGGQATAGECLSVMRTALDYGKVTFGYNAFD